VDKIAPTLGKCKPKGASGKRKRDEDEEEEEDDDADEEEEEEKKPVKKPAAKKPKPDPKPAATKPTVVTPESKAEVKEEVKPVAASSLPSVHAAAVVESKRLLSTADAHAHALQILARLSAADLELAQVRKDLRRTVTTVFEAYQELRSVTNDHARLACVSLRRVSDSFFFSGGWPIRGLRASPTPGQCRRRLLLVIADSYLEM
jgi:hypothetical protein